MAKGGQTLDRDGDVERSVGKQLRQDIRPDTADSQLWSAVLCNHVAKGEMGSSASEEMEGNCHKEKKDGGM